MLISLLNFINLKKVDIYNPPNKPLLFSDYIHKLFFHLSYFFLPLRYDMQFFLIFFFFLFKFKSRCQFSHEVETSASFQANEKKKSVKYFSKSIYKMYASINQVKIQVPIVTFFLFKKIKKKAMHNTRLLIDF